MKLYQIWNAVSTSTERPVSPWGLLTSLKKPPKVAYRILKFGAKLAAEFDVIEKQRVKMIYEASGAEEGSQVLLNPGSTEYAEFVTRFNEFVSGESDLKPTDMTMEALIDALDAGKGNALSEADLAALEPFFQEQPEESVKPAE